MTFVQHACRVALFVLLLTLGPRLALADVAAVKPTLFLSCGQECFEDYLRQQLSYFDITRDPHRADFTLVIVRQPAGNGGERVTVTIGSLLKRAPALGGDGSAPSLPRGRAHSLLPAADPPRIEQSFLVPPGASVHTTRELLLQAVLRVLMQSLADTPHEAAFELALPARDGTTLSRLPDRWHYWVIAPEIGGTGEAGSGYYFAELTAATTVRRITEPSKIRLRGSYSERLSGYRLEDGERIRGRVYDTELRALYAHSIGEHWALGGLATGVMSEFENLRGQVRGGPVLELNVFPYRENATKQLRFAYQAGAWANWYFETNVAGLAHEVRPYHALSAVADVNQPWGSVQWVSQVNMFLDQPRRWRLSTGAVLTVRLVEGLAVSLEGTAALVEDLINLRQRPITDRELLLWTAQQPTRFLLEAELSLTYTFGSTHNTIVNPRFGRVDLDEE